MNILVFNRSYADFVSWKIKNFPKLHQSATLTFVGNVNNYLSVERNSLYIANRPLTNKEEDFVILRELVEIRLVRDKTKEL